MSAYDGDVVAGRSPDQRGRGERRDREAHEGQATRVAVR